jgi:transglutaminase-like putative cysteine protease
MKRFISQILVLVFVLTLIPGMGHTYTGEIVKRYKTPGFIATGMTSDGEFLWVVDRKEKRLYKVNPETGDVITSIESPAYWPMGLAWDGKHLWNADVKGGIPLSENYKGVIYKIDPEDGTILHTVSAPTNTPRGLTWDGQYLWCVDNSQNKIIQFDPDDGTTIKSFKAPANDPRGITYDGQYLWISDRMKDEIYMVSPETGAVIIIAEAPGKFTRGMAFFKDHLWALDSEYDEIFQMKVRDGQKFRKTEPNKSRVTYTHQVTNFGPGMLEELDVHIAIPKDRKNQELSRAISYTPGYTDLVTDKWDQQTAHFHQTNIKPGKTVNYEMIVECTTYDVRWFIYPDEVGKLDDIPQDIKDKYLVNNEKYRYDHPVIQDAIKKAINKKEDNPYWMARDLFNYLIDNMYYEMVGGWNTAPAVLERGNGSCSEYTFVYIALCRAVGIPARYVGSVVVRGDEASFDDVFHRWVEIYLPNYGWIPVDPSGGDQKLPRDQANYIGHLSNRFLITTQSGGGSETMEWTYNSNDFWITEPKTYVVSDNYADWEPLD